VLLLISTLVNHTSEGPMNLSLEGVHIQGRIQEFNLGWTLFGFFSFFCYLRFLLFSNFDIFIYLISLFLE
jgi:hypothetical protein